MTLHHDHRAPYTSANAAITVLQMNREKGLTSPVTNETLIRLGVSESIARRTLNSFETLGLVDEDGTVSETLQGFHQLRGADEYREALQTFVRSTYEDVLHYANPEKDDLKRITEAFRGYEPAGQRSAMAALLIGLWRYAGLPTAEPEAAPREGKKTVGSGYAISSTPRSKPKTSPPVTSPSGRAPTFEFEGTLPPGLVGLLHQIPRNGGSWTTQERQSFLTAFEAVLNFTVPVNDTPRKAGTEVEAEQGDDP
jgi:hypothetical protein